MRDYINFVFEPRHGNSGDSILDTMHSHVLQALSQVVVGWLLARLLLSDLKIDSRKIGQPQYF